MLKRIKYVSRYARPLAADEIDSLAEQSLRNNQKTGITGVLMTSGSLFFQVLEGPSNEVDALFSRIRQDPRHCQVAVLAEETNVRDRLFPDWAMKTISLEKSRAERLEPLHAILDTIFASQETIQRLTGVLERAAWSELSYGASRAEQVKS